MVGSTPPGSAINMYNKEIKILPSLKNGYQQFYDAQHPLVYSNGCYYVHRHVASIKLDRWIQPTEHVHHIDGNKLNNDLSNIEVLTAEAHGKLHNPGNIASIKVINVLNNKPTYRKSSEIDYFCLNCGELFSPLFSSKGYYCSIQCTNKDRIKAKNLTKKILDELIPLHSWTILGPMFGYSDKGIKKRAIALGCDITRAKFRHNK